MCCLSLDVMRQWNQRFLDVQRPECLLAVVARMVKFQFTVMVFNHAVLRCRYVSSQKTRAASGSRHLDQFLTRELLHTTEQPAAPHHPGIDRERTAMLEKKNDTDQAVVAKRVSQAEGDCPPVRVGHHVAHLSKGITPSGEIELI